jgi:hypothetical protein
VGVTAQIGSVAGCTGTIPKAAALYGTIGIANGSVVITEASLIDVSYQGTGSFGATNGVRIAQHGLGGNGGGVFMTLSDSSPSPVGAWGVYDETGYNSYILANLLLGSTVDTGQQLQVAGTAKIVGNTLIGTTGAESLVVLNDGRVYGTKLHNNVNAITGTANQYIASGTYTPALTSGVNVTSTTARVCQFTRVGNVVTVSGSFAAVLTAVSLRTEVGLSLPVASNIANAWELGGAGAVLSATVLSPLAAGIVGDAANDRAAFVFSTNATITTTVEVTFSFTYQIL